MFTRLTKVNAKPVYAMANRRIFVHGACEIWSLSPNDAVFQNFLKVIGGLVPSLRYPHECEEKNDLKQRDSSAPCSLIQ